MTPTPAPATSSAPTAPVASPQQADYWRRTRRLTALLLSAWFVITFITVFFARELSGVTLFGWPLSFYMAAQGATLIYLIIVGVYAWRMRRLEKIYDSDRPDEK